MTGKILYDTKDAGYVAWYDGDPSLVGEAPTREEARQALLQASLDRAAAPQEGSMKEIRIVKLPEAVKQGDKIVTYSAFRPDSAELQGYGLTALEAKTDLLTKECTVEVTNPGPTEGGLTAAVKDGKLDIKSK